MSDIDALKEMLDRAGVKWKQGDSWHPAAPPVPGARSIRTLGEHEYDDEGERIDRSQPLNGGYSGFYTEFVFDASGKLIAVWGWE